MCLCLGVRCVPESSWQSSSWCPSLTPGTPRLPCDYRRTRSQSSCYALMSARHFERLDKVQKFPKASRDPHLSPSLTFDFRLHPAGACWTCPRTATPSDTTLHVEMFIFFFSRRKKPQKWGAPVARLKSPSLLLENFLAKTLERLHWRTSCSDLLPGRASHLCC